MFLNFVEIHNLSVYGVRNFSIGKHCYQAQSMRDAENKENQSLDESIVVK